MPLREELASGARYLALVTALLQRRRLADPTGGLWEAADLQWWWRRDRPSDRVGQAFWLDDRSGEPVAAAVLTDWGRTWACDVLLAAADGDGAPDDGGESEGHGTRGAGVAARLAACSLYDPALDLAVEAPGGEVAAVGLFWADPTTRVGLVEPMGTEAPYRRLGLARHLLAAGLDRLAAKGCARLKVSYEADNPAARDLYLGAGFVPESTNRVYRRRRP